MASLVVSGDQRQKLPDDVLWKIFEFKPATDYEAGCAIYVEDVSLQKDMPGDVRVLKISVLFKFNRNISPDWVRWFQTRRFDTRLRNIGHLHYNGRTTKQLKFERIIPKNEDSHTKAVVTLSYSGRFRYKKTMRDEDIFTELKHVLPILLSSLCQKWFVESEYVLLSPLDLEYWDKQMENFEYQENEKRYRLFSYFKMKVQGRMALSKRFTTNKLKY